MMILLTLLPTRKEREEKVSELVELLMQPESSLLFRFGLTQPVLANAHSGLRYCPGKIDLLYEYDRVR